MTEACQSNKEDSLAETVPWMIDGLFYCRERRGNPKKRWVQNVEVIWKSWVSGPRGRGLGTELDGDELRWRSRWRDQLALWRQRGWYHVVFVSWIVKTCFFLIVATNIYEMCIRDRCVCVCVCVHPFKLPSSSPHTWVSHTPLF